MKCFCILTILILININLCAIDKQIVVSQSITTGTTSTTINRTSGAAATTAQFYDNVFSFRMKYFKSTGDDETYSSHTGSIASVMGQAAFLYSWNRDNSGSSLSSTGPFVDSDATISNGNLFAKYYTVQYKTNKVDYPYIAFNVIPNCLAADPTAPPTDLTLCPPMLTFLAKFFCSDEEAKVEYDKIVAAMTANANVALVTMDGTCTSQADLDNIGTRLTGTVTVCQLLQGNEGANAECKA